MWHVTKVGLDRVGKDTPMSKEQQSLERKEMQIIIMMFLNSFLVGLARNTQKPILEGLALVVVPGLIAIIVSPKKDWRFSWRFVGMASMVLAGMGVGLLLFLSFSEKNDTLYWLSMIVTYMPWILILIIEKRKKGREAKPQATL